MNEPLISIVIPARNAHSTLKKCLDSIFNLKYSNREVIVIDDGSTDDTAKIVTEYKDIKILTTSGEGPAKARNLALRLTEGEFIAFTDADCIVDPLWLSELLRGFAVAGVAGVGGAQKNPDDDSSFGKTVHEFFSAVGFITDYMKSGTKIKQTNHNPTCNVMYRKSILVELGGFLEGLWPGEDVELDYRLRKMGYRLNFNPAAIVFHYRPANFRVFNKMMFRYGKAQGILVRKYGFFRPIQILPIFIFISLLALLYNFIFGCLFFILILTPLLIKLLIRIKYPLLVFRLFIVSVFNWNLGFLHGLSQRKFIG